MKENHDALLGISIPASGVDCRDFGLYWRRDCSCRNRKTAVRCFSGIVPDFFGNPLGKARPSIVELNVELN